MSIRIVFITLLSATLLSSCSSPTHSDIRPEVAQPLNEAMHLSGYFAPNKDAIMAKINQAASVPNLNSAERHQIVVTRDYALARAGHGAIPGAQSGVVAPGAETARSSINAVFPYR